MEMVVALGLSVQFSGFFGGCQGRLTGVGLVSGVFGQRPAQQFQAFT